jgi:hypothetical protein
MPIMAIMRIYITVINIYVSETEYFRFKADDNMHYLNGSIVASGDIVWDFFKQRSLDSEEEGLRVGFHFFRWRKTTRREIMKSFDESLLSNNIFWIKKKDKHWVIDLDSLRYSFSSLEELNAIEWFNGSVTIEHELEIEEQGRSRLDIHDTFDSKSYNASVCFYITQECKESNFGMSVGNDIPRVFISYSHDNEKHKNWVLQLATRLRSNGIDVILDRWNLKLGSDIAQFMEKGLSKLDRVICICTNHYVVRANNGIRGVGYEKRIIVAEYLADQNNNYVIPLLRDNESGTTPTCLAGLNYIDFRDNNLYESKYEELLRDLLDEPVLPIPPIGKNPFQVAKEFSQQKFIPSSEKYVSPSPKGLVSFDFSNNNGRYFIGQNELMFELSFSKASDRRIYMRNDPTCIKTIALVKDLSKIELITDARSYDTSSRDRCPAINQIVVIQNTNGFYAAIKILAIEDDTRGVLNDKITFEYVIQTNGSPDFTRIGEY